VLGFAGPDEVAVNRKIYDDIIATRTGEQFVSSVTNDWFSALCPTIGGGGGAGSSSERLSRRSRFALAFAALAISRSRLPKVLRCVATRISLPTRP